MRRFLSLLTVLVLALAATALPMAPQPAEASDVWSWDDPVFEVNGQRVAVNLGVRQKDVTAVTGATVNLTVYVGSQDRVVIMEAV